ncbi:radical SAM protein [Clostridium sp.]|uniref:radical SAM/SPASM domain-containing protein n=1 Tax=Clostridium sp. TaxID=1506 RepID=UPI0032175E50
MKYKKSYYNIEYDNKIDGNALIFNAVSGALGLMDENDYSTYCGIEELEYDDCEENENIKDMYKNGYILKEDIDEIKKIELEHRLLRYSVNGALHITIAPTMRCNMQCPYCYEHKENKDMSLRVENDLIEYIENYLSKNKKINTLSVAWYGGEPLLMKETIVRISERFIEYCKKNNVTYTSNIVSNGVLLDFDTAVTLKEKCLVSRAQITLDGIEETNNKTRVLKSRENSFEIITKNIESIRDIIKVSIRMNVSKENIQECDKLINYVKDKNWNENVNLYFAPVIAYNNSNSETKNSCFEIEEFNKEWSTLENHLVSENFKGNITYPENFFGCSALGVHSLVIDPEGNFSKCWHRINLPQHFIGNIYDGIEFNKEHTDWLMMDTPEKCNKCKVFPICRGGCPEKRIEDNMPNCDYSEDEIKETIYNYYNNMNINKYV